MLLAVTANTIAGVEPTITLGAVGIISAILGSAATGVYVIVRSTVSIQRSFERLSHRIALLEEQNKRQDTELVKISVKLDAHNEFLMSVRAIEDTLERHDKHIDKFEDKVQRLIEALGHAGLNARVVTVSSKRPERD